MCNLSSPPDLMIRPQTPPLGVWWCGCVVVVVGVGVGVDVDVGVYNIHSGGFFLGVQFVLADSGIPYALEDSTATYLLPSVLE